MKKIFFQTKKITKKFYNTETHFGFKTVKESEKQTFVSEVFHKVANKYDLMNDLMSGGLHRYWKDELVKRIDPKPGCTILDMAGGTGILFYKNIF
jgi:ubiquinone/menaquinone biosynthesis C-methylase UbiE